jgi:hypothetical protein
VQLREDDPVRDRDHGRNAPEDAVSQTFVDQRALVDDVEHEQLRVAERGRGDAQALLHPESDPMVLEHARPRIADVTLKLPFGAGRLSEGPWEL